MKKDLPGFGKPGRSAVLSEGGIPLALKEVVRSKLSKAREGKVAFETKYGTSFAEFRRAWEAEEIADRHSYQVEMDYWEWEAAVTDEARLEEMEEQFSDPQIL